MTILALSLLAVVAGGSSKAQDRPATGGDVLLTFDTEFEDDAASIVSLALNVPATYFWTGSYAQRYPDLLRQLAEQGNTIGSHSFHHDDLTTIDARQMQLDLELAKLVLEQISGVPITAFRAPYLQYDGSVMAEVARLGHIVDSSDKSPWPRNRHLLEVAVSEFENLLVSDFDLFEGRHLDDETARDFLIRAYAHHAATGQPFVVLLHPRIIGRRADVLHDFVAHVRESGGRFLTLDGYLDNIARFQGPRRQVIWLDLEPGSSAEGLADLAFARGASDVILGLQDLTGQNPVGPTRAAATVARLQARGIRVHLAFAVTHNPALARELPGGAMVDTMGSRSAEWVSPAHPEVRRRLAQDAASLVAGLGADGLHLHGLGYPALVWDFSPAALHRFSAELGVTNVAAEDILSQHYLIWTQWRAREVASLVSDIAASVRGVREDLVISLSLDAESATNYRVQERTGQNLRLLGGLVDLAVLWMSDPNQPQATLGQTLLAARTQAGDRLLLTGLRWSPAPGSAMPPLEANALALRMAIALHGGAVVDLRTATD